MDLLGLASHLYTAAYIPSSSPSVPGPEEGGGGESITRQRAAGGNTHTHQSLIRGVGGMGGMGVGDDVGAGDDVFRGIRLRRRQRSCQGGKDDCRLVMECALPLQAAHQQDGVINTEVSSLM